MSETRVAPQTAWVDPPQRNPLSMFFSRLYTLSLVEVQKIRHDRAELYTRAIQPALWLLIFGATFTNLKAIPTGNIPYLDYLAPGIMAQSVLIIAIFYGIQVIWERDAGVLSKLLVTPTPRTALVAGKAFAAGIRAVTQAVVIMLIALVLGVSFNTNPLKILGVLVIVVLGAAIFSCFSIILAGIVLRRDRLMGIGQAITMPLFFGSNALYPVELMPGWLQTFAAVNPLSYMVNALRALLLDTPGTLVRDFAVMGAATIVAIVLASAMMGRLAR